ncbi:MAG TPA: FkbM family methyltransferase [Candidatus Acidoferrales bacterium]|nr:FkbM family methyltransferase [Candidatus Acidoferrales bacterium]
MPQRPIFWQVLSPLMFAIVPVVRDYMREGGALPFKRWLYRCFLDPYTNVRTERFETTSVYGTRFEGTLSGLVQRRVFHFGVFEPNLSRFIWETLAPGDTFVDVGANVGYFAVLAARAVGAQGRVVAIEAAPSTFAALEATLERNATTNVRAVNRAAYDRTAVLPMYTVSAEENAGGASVAKTVGPLEAEVVAQPLAEILERDEIARARIVKIDVEGAEAAAVAGLVPALGQTRPDLEIVVEVLAETKDRVSALLAAAGYVPRVLVNPPDGLTSERGGPEYLIYARPRTA